MYGNPGSLNWHHLFKRLHRCHRQRCRMSTTMSGWYVYRNLYSLSEIPNSPIGPNTPNDTKTISAWQLQTCDSGEYCCRAANSTKSCCNDPTASRVTTPLSATLQTSSLVPAATNSQDQQSSSHSSAPTALANPACDQQNNQTAIVGGTLGGILGGIIIGLALTVRWMYQRERRQRRLKKHYEAQMSKTNAYRKALETSAGSARPSLSVEEDDDLTKYDSAA